MKLFHHDKSEDLTNTEADSADAASNAEYDAQADLALPTTGSNDAPVDGFVPFGGELAPEAPSAGYDIERDTGVPSS